MRERENPFNIIVGNLKAWPSSAWWVILSYSNVLKDGGIRVLLLQSDDHLQNLSAILTKVEYKNETIMKMRKRQK